MDLDSPRDEKKKRRFSSPFHRSSRSRSRPSSIVLPPNIYMDFGNGPTPRSTSPRETPPIGGNRPHTYHAPDAWNTSPDPHWPLGPSTPPRTGLQPPERLGVLPSPAKSAFSLYAQDKDEDVPPVPPIPDGAEDMPRGRQSQDRASHTVLQSVIRYSTPPIMESSRVPNPPIFIDPSAARDVDQKMMGTSQQDTSTQQAVRNSYDEDDTGPGASQDFLPSKTLGRASDVPRSAAPNTFEAGEISPAVSSLGPARSDMSYDGNEKPRSTTESLGQDRPHIRGDISPMILPVAISTSSTRGAPESPVRPGVPHEGQSTYETQVIGAGDVSPMLSPTIGDEEAPPTKKKEVARQTGVGIEDIQAAEVGGVAQTPQYAAAGKNGAAPPPPVATQQRLSASPYHVVHAVQYVPSRSSYESLDWEQDNVAVPSLLDGSQLGVKQQDRDLPPVPQIVQQPAQIQSVVAPNQKPLDDAPVKPSIEEYPPTPSSTSQESEQNAMADTANPGSHKRSQSLLSAISSMVSEDSAPVSPVSSQTRKSRPSSRGRQRQASLPKPTPSSVAIVEELDPVQPQGMATADDPDLDLYADHNGIVKGVQDERGQPLRVAAFQDSGVSQASYPSTSRAAKAVDLSDPEEDTRRNSVERPMSFISGPTDDNGMPQDEINRPGPTGAGPQIPSTPQTPSKLQGQYQRRPRRNHTETHQSQVNNQPNEQDQVLRSPEKKPGYSNVYSPQNSRRPQQAQVPPHSDVSPPPSSNVSPPPQPSAPPGLAQRRLLQDSNPQSGTDQVSGMQDPRLQVQNPNAQLASHTADPRTFGVISGGLSSQDPRLRMPMQTQTHGPDPRIQAHQMPQPPAPRTHVEQMMQRPVVNPPLQNGGYRMPGIESPELNTHSAKEKSSSRPKLSSVFKSLGGRSSSSTQQTSNQKNDRINPDPAATGVLNRSAQPQLPAPVLPAEQAVAKKKERKSGTFGSMPSRSQSVETESHVSHASLDSTRVQATDSRLDLRYPTNPVPFRGIPPQQPPPGTPPPPPPKQQTQRASTSGIPEAGKKKRFSSLGALFGRSGTTGHAVPAKSKSSRDDKKSQKIQKHNLSIQPPPAQQWNPQQQRPIPPYNSQYGPPLATARSGPGMQSMAPPQGGPPRDTPRYYQSPQGYQQQQQTYPQQGRPDTSAYAGTRQIAQAHQFQQQGVQAPPASVSNARPPMPDPQFSFEPITPPTDSVQNPPPAGYYPPDRKPPVHDNTTPVSMPAQRVALQQQPQNQGYPQPPSQPHPQPQPLPQQQNAAPQHQANMRRVSSPTSSRGPTPMSAVSQVHRRVSSPMAEPQYETPQIPAAYNPVSGPYVAGEHQPPQPHLQNARPPPAPYGTTPDRQYSDSRMQPLSPQVSAQSQMIPNQRTHSDASSVSLVSPVANQNPASATRAGSPASNPRLPRMTSISEATHPERPWNLNLPEGATEQEIVRARQKHYLEQQLATQEQLHAERTGQSPSPRPSPNTQSPSPNSPLNQAVHESRPSQQQGAGGFREVLPRGAPQLYDLGHDQHEPTISHVHSPHPLQPAPIHPEQVGPPASYALPMSPASMNTRSPVNHLTDALPPPPPPKIPHSPMRPDFAGSQSPLHHTPQHIDHQPQHFEPPPPEQEPDYEQQPPDEPPPSYSGPGLPNDGMDKERPRLPSIMTDAEIRGSHDPDPRRRQLSVTMLQHPQPASMAASPQRSSADMGADILRRQMFEQADRDRKEREQRADAERAQSERERQERDLNRARARELERSYSGGGSVGSLRSQNGSGRGTGRGRGARGGARPIFELPAVEDDEPVMRATSFPGQEWVPRWDED
ncbi:hypothetical protein BDV95DRAFT_582999 [Massariosphaeria phaeospora]|uniref:Uncharacterized protein n=1 Tax=Massariosphaeria phaeospora TaxID=100035 RepID=A0A7C8I0E9_9PLEO|nr:hypothetical protein BDV95DRAFT_582999 [Massariosphaeria phaeospora]